MDRVVITNRFCGICHMQVCAVDDATDDEILEICNRENPAGSSAGWCDVCRDGAEFLGTDISPVVCNDDSTRRHFMVAC